MIERSTLVLLLVGLPIGLIAVVKLFTTAILLGAALATAAWPSHNHQNQNYALQPRPNLSGAGFYPAPTPHTRGLVFLVQVASYRQFPVTRPLST